MRRRSVLAARDLLRARSSEAVTLDDLVPTAECGTKQRLIRGFRAAFGFTPRCSVRADVRATGRIGDGHFSGTPPKRTRRVRRPTKFAPSRKHTGWIR